MRMTIGKKLALGFAAVLALMACSAGTTYVSLASMNKSVASLVNESFPEVSACDRMLIACNHARAALREYMILGDDPQRAESLKKDRAEAWMNIDAAMTDLTRYFEQSTDAQDKASFDALASSLGPFKSAQQSVEDIVHTDDNIPSQKILLNQAMPTADKVAEAVTAMIDAESSLEATAQRKKLLKDMSDFRDLFTQCRASSRAYLMTGKEDFRKAFETDWDRTQAAYKAINLQAELLMGDQPQHWSELKEHLRAFEPLPREMFASLDCSK